MSNEDARPPPPAWLDKDLVQKVLRTAEGDSDITVLSCNVYFANAVGDGYTADMYRVNASLSDSELYPLVVKCHPQGGMREEFIEIMGAFTIETKMLTETLPAMNDLLQKACSGKYQPFGAKCLYHSNDPYPFIVLEDLRHSGFTLAKRQQGVDLDHCLLALKTIARFHATSLVLGDQDKTALKFYDNIPYREETRKSLSPFFERGIRSLEEQTSNWPGYEKYTEKLKHLRETCFDRLIEVSKRKENDLNVLVHGDPHTGNMMFRYTDEGLQDTRLVDFQTLQHTSPGQDLQYFLFTCPNDNVRINHMESLIQEYHSAFNETLNDLGYSKYEISMPDLRRILKEHASFGMIMSICGLPFIVMDPSDSFDMEAVLNSNEVTHVNNSMYENKTYIQVMKRLLPEFEKNGLL